MTIAEKRLIDANAIPYHKSGFPKIPDGTDESLDWVFRDEVDKLPTVDAVPVDAYNELREAFVDYVCSGIQNPAPYCKNRCAECVNSYGYCITTSDKCRGFNPDGGWRTNHEKA